MAERHVLIFKTELWHSVTDTRSHRMNITVRYARRNTNDIFIKPKWLMEKELQEKELRNSDPQGTGIVKQWEV
jgi:hypothetical protein